MRAATTASFIFAFAALPADRALADQADVDKARVLREAASDAYDKKDFQTCKDKASASFQAAKQSQSAGLLGLCEAGLHEWRDAAEHLTYGLKFDTNAQRQEMYRASLAETKPHVGQIDVTSQAAGVDVLLDDKPEGTAPTTRLVNPGHYVVSGRRGGQSAKVEIDIVAGAEKPVDLQLTGAAGGDVRPLWPGIAALSVGVVGLAVGGGLIGLHASKISDATTLGKSLDCSSTRTLAQCQPLADKASSAQTIGNAGAGLLIGGGVVAAAGVGLLIWGITGPKAHDSQSGEGEPWLVVPVVGTQAGGFIVGRRF